MDNKSSSGYDGLSNKIIKTIKNEVSKPLTLIINQMITSGIFPDDLKIAKIIPLYKKGDKKFHNQLSTNFSSANIIKDI